MDHVKIKQIFSLALLVFLVGCRPPADLLLKIERHNVKIDAIYNYLPRRDLPLYSKTQLDSLVQELLSDQLMLYDAYKQKYHQRDEVKTTVAAFHYNYCIEFFIKRHFIDSLITEKVLIDRYRALSPDYRDYHPFKKVRDDLYEDELAKRRLIIAEAVADYYQHLKIATMLRLLQPAFDHFLAQYNELVRNTARGDSLEAKPVSILESMHFDSAFAQIKNRQYNRTWLINLMKLRQIDLPRGVLSPASFYNVIETLILEELIYHQSKSEKFDQEPAFRQAVQKYREKTMLHLYQIENISKQIVALEDSLQAFYQKNIARRYLSPAAVEVWTIFAQDSLEAKSVLQKALQGQDFAKLYHRYNARPLKNQGYLGLITANDYGEIGKTALTAGPNCVIPKLVNSGKYFVVIKTGRFIPARPIDYQLVRKEVAKDYSKEKYDAIRSRLTQSLLQKYQTKIYLENLYQYVAKMGAEN
jgi:hypothetical protein